jgi:hypothetical protein
MNMTPRFPVSFPAEDENALPFEEERHPHAQFSPCRRWEDTGSATPHNTAPASPPTPFVMLLFIRALRLRFATDTTDLIFSRVISHSLTLSLSLSRKAAAGIRCAEVQCGVLEAPSPQKISLFSYREKFEVDWFRVFNPTSRKRSFPLFSFFAKKVSRRCSVAQNT